MFPDIPKKVWVLLAVILSLIVVVALSFLLSGDSGLVRYVVDTFQNTRGNHLYTKREERIAHSAYWENSGDLVITGKVVSKNDNKVSIRVTEGSAEATFRVEFPVNDIVLMLKLQSGQYGEEKIWEGIDTIAALEHVKRNNDISVQVEMDELRASDLIEDAYTTGKVVDVGTVRRLVVSVYE